MTYVQPHLISSHAQLISAPHVSSKKESPWDELIKQQQYYNLVNAGMQNGQGGKTYTQTIRTPDGSGSGQGENRAAPRTTFIGLTESPQEQLAKRQAAKALQDDINNQVVESKERFGKHSPDAVWDPANGGAWVRPYRPGEKEALAQGQMNAVNSQDWEYRYTRQQQMEQEKLRNAYSDIMSDPTLSADEKKYMGDQVAKQFYGIQKMPYEKEREDEATKYQREKDVRDYEAKIAEAQAKRVDLEEKRYQDAVLKLEQERKVTKPVTDEFGNTTYKETYAPYTEEEKDKILRKVFPERFENKEGSEGTKTETDDEKMKRFIGMFQQMKADQDGASSSAGAPTPIVQQKTEKTQTAVQPPAQDPVQQPTTEVSQDDVKRVHFDAKAENRAEAS